MDYIYLKRDPLDSHIIYGYFPETILLKALCQMACEDYKSVSPFRTFTLRFTSLKTAHRVCEQISRISGVPCKWNLPFPKR